LAQVREGGAIMGVVSADDPLAFLKQEVADGDQHIRVQAMERVRYIAFALSTDPAKRAERIEKDLVPFLLEVCNDRETHGNEELRHKIGMNLCSLGFMLDKERVACLLPICQILCEEEEGNVRETGIASLNYIGEFNPKLGDQMYPMLKKLIAADWFTSRLSAVQWIPDLYKHVKEDEQKELCTIYQAMCNDEAPMVKRLAASNFDRLFPELPKEYILNPVGSSEQSLLQTFVGLATDSTQDSIRRSCVDGAVALSGIFSPEENRQHILILLQTAAEDKSWRVRLKLAQRFSLICQKLQPEQTSQFILTSFGNLLRDSEQEVRITSTTAIGEAVQFIASNCLRYSLVQRSCIAGCRAGFSRKVLAVQLARGPSLTGRPASVDRSSPAGPRDGHVPGCTLGSRKSDGPPRVEARPRPHAEGSPAHRVGPLQR
jgi:serine/threonine-protein phosphatase 2A regulatory subunit A